jgi:plasmid stabilization system protein ParE
MIYQVVLNDRAEKQLEEAYVWYAERSPASAVKWYNGFLDTLESLRTNPARCQIAAENPLFSVEVRQLLYGRRKNHRALFTIRGNIVFVFSVRHTAQRDATPEDL